MFVYGRVLQLYTLEPVVENIVFLACNRSLYSLISEFTFKMYGDSKLDWGVLQRSDREIMPRAWFSNQLNRAVSCCRLRAVNRLVKERSVISKNPLFKELLELFTKVPYKSILRKMSQITLSFYLKMQTFQLQFSTKVIADFCSIVTRKEIDWTHLFLKVTNDNVFPIIIHY